jgi:hypothetical protein
MQLFFEPGDLPVDAFAAFLNASRKGVQAACGFSLFQSIEVPSPACRLSRKGVERERRDFYF